MIFYNDAGILPGAVVEAENQHAHVDGLSRLIEGLVRGESQTRGLRPSDAPSSSHLERALTNQDGYAAMHLDLPASRSSSYGQLELPHPETAVRSALKLAARKPLNVKPVFDVQPELNNPMNRLESTVPTPSFISRAIAFQPRPCARRLAILERNRRSTTHLTNAG